MLLQQAPGDKGQPFSIWGTEHTVVEAIEANTVQPIHVLTDMVEMGCPDSVLLRESRDVLDGLLPYPIVMTMMENYQFGNLDVLF